MRQVKMFSPGQRVILTEPMLNDPRPVPVGTCGTVTGFNPVSGAFAQVSIDWDNGQRLMAILPDDQIELLN